MRFEKKLTQFDETNLEDPACRLHVVRCGIQQRRRVYLTVSSGRQACKTGEVSQTRVELDPEKTNRLERRQLSTPKVDRSTKSVSDDSDRSDGWYTHTHTHTRASSSTCREMGPTCVDTQTKCVVLIGARVAGTYPCEAGQTLVVIDRQDDHALDRTKSRDALQCRVVRDGEGIQRNEAAETRDTLWCSNHMGSYPTAKIMIKRR